jgi:hypothetical protein
MVPSGTRFHNQRKTLKLEPFCTAFIQASLPEIKTFFENRSIY